jgi:hypothetical protein
VDLDDDAAAAIYESLIRVNSAIALLKNPEYILSQHQKDDKWVKKSTVNLTHNLDQILPVFGNSTKIKPPFFYRSSLNYWLYRNPEIVDAF